MIGNAEKLSDDTSLYTIKWNPENYRNGVHRIKVVVQDILENQDVTFHEFAVDKSIKSFGYISTWLLQSDQIVFVRNVYYACTLLAISIFMFFRFTRCHHTVVNRISWGFVRSIILAYFKRFALLCSVDVIYWYFIISTLYVAIGPWFYGEILDNQFGLCFAWGIFVNRTFLKEDVQYMFGIFHLLWFQLPLVFDLSYQIEASYSNIHNQNPDQNNIRSGIFRRILSHSWKHISFICLVVNTMLILIENYHSYSIVSVAFGPLKTWNLIIAFYLKRKCFYLRANDFNLDYNDPDLVTENRVKKSIE